MVRRTPRSRAAWGRAVLFASCLGLWLLTAFGAPALGQDASGDADRDWRFIQKLEEDGMADLAVRQLEQFAMAHPRDPRAPFALQRAATGLRGLGQVDRARSLYEKLLREHPSSEVAPAAALARADLLTEAQQFAAAAEAYRSLLSAYPAAGEAEAARLGLAEALMAQGDDQQARALLGRLIGGRADEEIGSRALFDLALLDQRAGADSLAIERFDAIHERYPGRPIAAFGLLRAAALLEQREAFGAARIRYERVLESFGEPLVRARAHLALAGLVEEEDPERAMEHYRAVAEEGGSADDVQAALIGLARAALAAGETEVVREAEGAFMAKYPMSPRRPEIRIYSLQGDLADRAEGSVEALATFAQTAPAPVAHEAYALAAAAHEDRGEFERALETWRQAERVAPDGARRARALLAESSLASRLGRPSLAADLALSARAAAEDDDVRARALLRAVEGMIAAERPVRAIELAEQLVTTHPITPWATQGRAHLEALRRAGTYDAAAANDALAALALRPIEDEVQRGLEVASILRDRAGRHGEAIAVLEDVAKRAQTPQQRALVEIGLARTLRQLALTRGLAGDDEAARRALTAAREAFTEAAARSAAEDESRTARLGLVALDLASRARPDAPWLFDPDSEPLLGAVGPAEALDLTSSDFDAARRRLDSVVEDLRDADDRVWVAWRRAELSTAPLEERIAAVREALRIDADPELRDALHATLGQLLLDAGATADAAREFSRVIDRAPDGALAMSVRYALAEAQRAERRYAQAGALYLEFATAQPQTQKGQRSLLLAGDCALYAGRWDEAVERYRQLLERYPESVYEDDALYRLGTALQRTGRTEAAREPLQTLVDARSDYRGRALGRLASIERSAGRAARAASLYAELVDVDPDRALEEGAYLALTQLAIEADEPRTALQWLDARDARVEPDARGLALRVRASARAGRVEDAAKALDRLSRGFPDAGDAIAAARIDVADVLVERGNGEAAIEAYRIAATETRDRALRAHAAYGEALVHAREQRWADAVASFEETIDRGPDSEWAAEAWFKLGQYYGRTEKPRESQRAFAALVERFPGHTLVAEALRGEARAWRLLNRFDEALERYHAILERFPDAEGSEDVLSNIAYCHHEMGQYEVAIAAYQRVMPYLDQEGQAYAQFWIADSLGRLGRFEESATEFLRIPYLYPDQGQLPVTAQLKAGEAYEQVPDVEAARRLYERVLSAHGPNSQWGGEAKRRLDRLAEGDRDSR